MFYEKVVWSVSRVPRSSSRREQVHAARASYRSREQWAYDMQSDIGEFGFGGFMSKILGSLPTLRAPLRVLSLQRGFKTPFTGAVTDIAVCCACISEVAPSFWGAASLLHGRHGRAIVLGSMGVGLKAFCGLRR